MSSHAVLSAKLVDARNQRYFPLASHTGHVASASPSVTCLVRPLSTSYTKTARNCEGSRFAYAIHLESGLHVGLSERSGAIISSPPTTFAVPLATSTTHSRRWVS